LLALSLLLAPRARAAEVTEVADAMDKDRKIEIDLDFAYRHLRKDTRLTRENLQNDAAGNPSVVYVDELQHTQSTDEMAFRLAVGLWHDLEIHFLAPLVLRDRQSWDFATVNGQSVASTSTLANNTIEVSGCLKPGSCTAVAPIVPTPGRSQRSGFRDPTVGVAWAPINQEREAQLHPELYPTGEPAATWVLAFDYTLPLPGQLDDPSKFGAATLGNGSSYSGPMLRKAHVFTAWTAFSKRFRAVDPYFVVRASAPVAIKSNGPGDGAYDNCWHPEALADVATANCPDPAWKNQTGYQPPYEASFTLGAELPFYDDPHAHQKFALDLHGDVHYTGPGRGYTQITDALGKLTYADEFVTAGATLGLYGRAARWLTARLTATLAVDTPHLITSEAIGKDLNGDGRVSLASGGRGSTEQSPTYDFRLDQPGRRLRAEAALTWGIGGSLALSF
jgi:hypothetical protein